MRVVIEDNENQVAEYAYEIVRDALVERQYKVLGLPTGGTPLRLYSELIAGLNRSEIDFSDIITFNLDEYLGLAPDHPDSCRYFMETNLFEKINIKPSNIHFLNGLTDNVEAECGEYEDQIAAVGGIKLQILGIGRDGHIGFNEPGTSLESRTHYVMLAKETIADNARFFNRARDVPRWALTMGVGTVMDSEQILLLATGEYKAEAVAAMIEGPITQMCTASALQSHPDVTVVIDQAAAGKLRHLDYWRQASDDYDEMYDFLSAARRGAGLEDGY
ncbi:MAG: glucosamine-6-phosphate deaminase [Victivallales bacterium]|nr:glucosamine-6-phosphate deaminase [Victivallales bacterium]